jgi:N-acetylneuraminate synthase
MCADAGADAIKFQLFTAAQMYPSNCGIVDTFGGAVDFFELLHRLELPHEWLPALHERAATRGIVLLFSAFDEEAVDLTADFETPAFKVASPEITHIPLLRRVGRHHRPVILSTGMSGLGDIEEALAALATSGAGEVALLQCVTTYPCPPDEANLDSMSSLRAAFGTTVGLSDHTLDPVAAPLVAAALGASVIEKHVTLSRALDGPDHGFSIEPGELAHLAAALRQLHDVAPESRLAAVTDRLGQPAVVELRGKGGKIVAPSEAALAACDRRSLHAVADITAGDALGPGNVAVLRGERNLRPGLHPRHWDDVQGALATRDVAYGQGIVWADLLTRAP